MLIGKKYKVESDNLNVTLYQKGTSKKSGEVYWRPIAYFASIENALIYLVDKEVKETGLTDLKTVLVKQAELYHLISRLKQG